MGLHFPGFYFFNIIPPRFFCNYFSPCHPIFHGKRLLNIDRHPCIIKDPKVLYAHNFFYLNFPPKMPPQKKKKKKKQNIKKESMYVFFFFKKGKKYPKFRLGQIFKIFFFFSIRGHSECGQATSWPSLIECTCFCELNLSVHFSIVYLIAIHHPIIYPSTHQALYYLSSFV